jgi:hypothetical protein
LEREEEREEEEEEGEGKGEGQDEEEKLERRPRMVQEVSGVNSYTASYFPEVAAHREMRNKRK